MKKFFVLLTFSWLLVGCGESETAITEHGMGNSVEADKLKKENLSLKRDLAEKDSTINYYVAYVNQIRENLDLIHQMQGLVINHKANPELMNSENTDLVEDLKKLGALMAENDAKVKKLKSELKNSDLQMDAFEEMIMSLTEDVEAKNMEIYQLQQELENLDGAFSEIFEAFEEQGQELNEANAALNQAFFTYGTREELLENGVITKEGGFIGLGKINKLKSDFNKNYFTEVEISAFTEVPLGMEKAEIVTTHPDNSYELIGDDVIEKLVIKDAEAFWGVSKYLVIVVK